MKKHLPSKRKLRVAAAQGKFLQLFTFRELLNLFLIALLLVLALEIYWVKLGKLLESLIAEAVNPDLSVIKDKAILMMICTYGLMLLGALATFMINLMFRSFLLIPKSHIFAWKTFSPSHSFVGRYHGLKREIFRFFGLIIFLILSIAMIMPMASMPQFELLSQIRNVVMSLLVTSLFLLVLEVLWNRHALLKELSLSDQEFKKESEANQVKPEILQHQRQIQKLSATESLEQNVRQSKIIVIGVRSVI